MTATLKAAEKAGRKGLLGRKVGMTQIFDANGAVVPVTVIEAGPCPVDSRRAKRTAEAGKVAAAKAGCEPQRFVRELRGVYEGIEVGQVLTVELFEGVEFVDVTGTTKGRGTAGVMKRHGFKGQRASHGVKKVHRHQGGTSMNTSPARVFKGKRMAGRFGNERSTMRNVKLVQIDKAANLLVVRGAVPGPEGSYVVVRQTNKIKKVGVAAPTGKKKAGGK
jgi:large subunit ribosomal protein L3